MQQEVSRALSDNSAVRGEDPTSVVWVPPIEVSYRDGNFVISAELPGVEDEDIQVAITDDAVVIRGEREYQSESDEGGIRRTELRYGEFYRSIPLPDGADPDKARAELRNGVLQITVPVAEAKQGVRQIPVQAGSAPQSASSSPSSSSQPSEKGTSKTETTGSEKAA
jgi:HSP20 family protein